jgi:hypothetical protein
MPRIIAHPVGISLSDISVNQMGEQELKPCQQVEKLS